MRAFNRPELILIAILAFGAGLRFVGLGTPEISDDEAFSWRIVQYSLPEMLDRLRDDANPPLYYVMLWGWTRAVGDSLADLRSMSAVFGGLTILMAYVATRRLLLDYGPWTTGAGERAVWAGVIAAAFVAIHPWQLVFSQVARAYAVGTFLAASSTWLLLLALSDLRTTRIWRWVAYGLTASAFAYAHYYAVFTLAAHAALAAWIIVLESRRGVGISRAVGGGLAAVATFLVSYAPWLPSLYAQARDVREGFWIPPLTVEGVKNLAFSFLTGFRSADEVVEWLGIALGLFALVALLRLRGGAGRYLLLMSAGTWVGAILISVLGHRPILIDRYLLFAQLFYLLALAMAVATLSPSPLRGGLLGLVIVTFGSAAWLVQGHRLEVDRKVEDLSFALAEQYSEGELVIFDSAATANRVMYYAQRFGVVIQPRILAAGLEGRGHKVHAASIPRDEWVVPEELTFGHSRRFWTISGDSLPIAHPPDGWKPVRSRLYAGAEGTRLSITQWETGEATPTPG